MITAVQSYRDLIVWQKALKLSVETYRFTKYFPRDEQFGLTSQMRRASVSIAANIAEGRHRGTKKEFIHFLHIAYGSAMELESHYRIAKELFPIENAAQFLGLLDEVQKMLNALISSLKPNS